MIRGWLRQNLERLLGFDPVRGRPFGEGAPGADGLDPETLEQLRALGYVR